MESLYYIQLLSQTDLISSLQADQTNSEQVKIQQMDLVLIQLWLPPLKRSGLAEGVSRAQSPACAAGVMLVAGCPRGRAPRVGGRCLGWSWALARLEVSLMWQTSVQCCERAQGCCALLHAFPDHL